MDLGYIYEDIKIVGRPGESGMNQFIWNIIELSIEI